MHPRIFFSIGFAAQLGGGVNSSPPGSHSHLENLDQSQALICSPRANRSLATATPAATRQAPVGRRPASRMSMQQPLRDIVRASRLSSIRRSTRVSKGDQGERCKDTRSPMQMD